MKKICSFLILVATATLFDHQTSAALKPDLVQTTNWPIDGCSMTECYDDGSRETYRALVVEGTTNGGVFRHFGLIVREYFSDRHRGGFGSSIPRRPLELSLVVVVDLEKAKEQGVHLSDSVPYYYHHFTPTSGLSMEPLLSATNDCGAPPQFTNYYRVRCDIPGDLTLPPKTNWVAFWIPDHLETNWSVPYLIPPAGEEVGTAYQVCRFQIRLGVTRLYFTNIYNYSFGAYGHYYNVPYYMFCIVGDPAPPSPAPLGPIRSEFISPSNLLLSWPYPGTGEVWLYSRGDGEPEAASPVKTNRAWISTTSQSRIFWLRQERAP